jgi:caspase domain-containing protein
MIRRSLTSTLLFISARPLISALLLSSALMPHLAGAQESRGSTEMGRPVDKDGEVTVGRYVFAGIGIDQYDSPEWDVLVNPVNDVNRMEETLRESFNFDSIPEWVLRDGQATQMAIRRLIDDLGQSLRPEDNLVFFYAGHGAERATMFDGEVVRRTGYIVPVSVKGSVKDNPSQYLAINEILADIAGLPSRHVLVILDSCFSGMALDNTFNKMRGESSQQARDLIGRRSRRVLTSAQADQLAADGGGRFEGNSLFTGWLAEGLRRAAEGTDEGRTNPDSNTDGMVTVTELFNFVSAAVGASSGSTQTPDFGAFELDDRGELVLMLDTQPFDQAYSSAVEAFHEGKFEAFTASAAEALELEDTGPRPSYLRFIQAQVDEAFGIGEAAVVAGRLLAALTELSEYQSAGEAVPLEGGPLMLAMGKARGQCAKLGCEAAVN